MSTEKNEKINIIKKFQKLMDNGQLKNALELVDQHAIWHSDEVGAPWSGIHHGIDAITEHFNAISGTTQEFKRHVDQFIVNDDLVIELGSLSCILSKTNKSFATEYVCLYTISNGKIISYRIFEDSLKLYRAYFNDET